MLIWGVLPLGILNKALSKYMTMYEEENSGLFSMYIYIYSCLSYDFSGRET